MPVIACQLFAWKAMLLPATRGREPLRRHSHRLAGRPKDKLWLAPTILFPGLSSEKEFQIKCIMTMRGLARCLGRPVWRAQHAGHPRKSRAASSASVLRHSVPSTGPRAGLSSGPSEDVFWFLVGPGSRTLFSHHTAFEPSHSVRPIIRDESPFLEFIEILAC